MGLNLLGAEFNLPVWLLTEGVDAVILVFVGTVLVGFHALESIHTTWVATKRTASASVSAGRKSKERISNIADRGRGEEEGGQ